MVKPVTPRKTKIITASLALLFAFGISFASEQDCIQNPNPDAQLSACIKLIDNWTQSEDKTRLALYHRQLAAAYTKKKQYENALENIEKAIGYDPDNAKNFFIQGWIFNNFDFHNRAIESFAAVTELADNSNDVGWGYYNLAISYELAKKPDIAKKHLKAAQEIASKLYANYLKELKYFRSRKQKRQETADKIFLDGLEAYEAKKYEKAIELFKTTLKIAPGNALYVGWLGSVYFDTGNYLKAIETLTSVPADEIWNYYLALSYVTQQEFEKARKAFEKAVSDAPPKNRSQNITKQAKQYWQKLKNYIFYLDKAQKAAEKKQHLIAVEFAQKALENLNTDKARDLKRTQFALYAKQQKTKKMLPWVIGLLTISIVFIIVFFTTGLKKIKNTFKKTKNQQNDDMAQKARLNPKGVFLEYLAEKDTSKDKPCEVAKQWSRIIAKSRDIELINGFLDELAPQDKKDYLLDAAWDLIGTKETGKAKQALLFLNKIPFREWGPQEAAVFTQGHSICDSEILKSKKIEDQKFWHREIPTEAYHTLAKKYFDDKDYESVNALILKIPMYIWDEKLWDMIIKIKTAQNTLDTIDITAIPEHLSTQVAEELCRRGHIRTIVNHILNQNKSNYKPDFYFYLFAYFGRTDFEKAWHYYREFDAQFDIRSNIKIYYAIALMCEILELFSKALEIYEKIIFTLGDYEDVRQRRAYIKQSRGHITKPSAREILANILPPDFFKKNITEE